MPQLSETHLNIAAKNVKQLPRDVAQTILKSQNGRAQMRALGFDVANMQVARDMASAYAMDSVQSSVTTASISNPIQFLQNWLPGQVAIMTAARKIDEIIGIATVGSYEDEQIVQEVLENLALAVPYGDYTNLPLSNWNLNFVTRTVVRFESGMRVGNLEEARSARVRVNSGEAKRQSCGTGLEIQRNLVGFNGYNSGNNNTYGFLNDPGLSAYVTVANTGTGSTTQWVNKSYNQIITDILVAIVQLRTQTKEAVDPNVTPLTLALPANAVDYLSTVSTFGNSVRQWLTGTYPNIRVVSAPQLNTANGGAGVFYLFADKVSDGLSTDGGDTWIQVVPSKFIVQGVQKMVKGYEEGYLNATAGAMCKRPVAVVRYTGIS